MEWIRITSKINVRCYPSFPIDSPKTRIPLIGEPFKNKVIGKRTLIELGFFWAECSIIWASEMRFVPPAPGGSPMSHTMQLHPHLKGHAQLKVVISSQWDENN